MDVADVEDEASAAAAAAATAAGDRARCSGAGGPPDASAPKPANPAALSALCGVEGSPPLENPAPAPAALPLGFRVAPWAGRVMGPTGNSSEGSWAKKQMRRWQLTPFWHKAVWYLCGCSQYSQALWA